MFLKYCPSISLLHPADIQRLMGCLAFCHRGLQNSPYKDLMAPWLWTDVAENFTKDACMLMGLGLESPLSIRWALRCIVHYHASTLCMCVRSSHTHTHTHSTRTHTHTHTAHAHTHTAHTHSTHTQHTHTHTHTSSFVLYSVVSVDY